MRLFLLRFLIKLFFKKQREIKKMSLGEELTAYRFKNYKDVEELLKHLRTNMMLWYWETEGKEDRNIVKGMGLMLNVLLQAHDIALKLDNIEDVDKRLHLWKSFKDKEKSNIWNNIIKAVRGNGAK